MAKKGDGKNSRKPKQNDATSMPDENLNDNINTGKKKK